MNEDADGIRGSEMGATQRRPTALIPTLPGHYYHDPVIYGFEQECIFSRMWVCVGHVKGIPRPGDYLCSEVGGESLIVLHGEDDALRVFFNVCRHRGARLCTADHGHLRGALQCRYHGWSYGLSGRLIGVPHLSELGAAGFDREKYGLVPVALAIWEGLVWVNLADAPEPIAQQLRPCITERFGDDGRFWRYRLGELRAARAIDYDVRANWKLIVENFLECYHCPTIHPELCRLLPSFRTGRAYQIGGVEFAADVEAFTMSGRAKRPRLPSLTPEDDRRYYGLVLRPNVFVNLLPDHVVLHTLRPQGPDRTRVTCQWLFDPGAMAQPGFDPTGAVEVFDLVNRQDWEACELVQLSVASKAFRHGGVFVPVERHVCAFDDFVLERLGSGLT